MPIHAVQLVRPGASSFHALRPVLQGAIRPLVVVPTPLLAYHVGRALAEADVRHAQVMVSLRQLAARLAGETAEAPTPLSGIFESAALRVAVRDAGGSVLAPMAEQASLQDVLGRYFRELRHHAVDPAPPAPSQDDAPTVSTAAARVFHRYRALTSKRQDVPGLSQRAAELLEQRTQPPLLFASHDILVLYLPARLDWADVRLLGQVGRFVAVQAILPWYPGSDELANQFTAVTATQLGGALGVAPEHASPPAPHSQHWSFVSAPDPAEEVRSLVRDVAAEMETGVPLWQMAVSYAAENPYGQLVREALSAAGLPWHSAEGRPATTGWAARSLLALLSLRERRFSREAVLEWLSIRPPRPSEHKDPFGALSAGAWERLSRRAGVQDGARAWESRMRSLAASLVEAGRHESAEHASAIADAVARVSRDLLPPEGDRPTEWSPLVQWVQRLREAYVPTCERWPAEEQAASDILDDTLARLVEAQQVEPRVTPRGFVEAFARALASRRLVEGRFGRGVLVGPLSALVGLHRQRVFVAGMNEGAIPSRPAVDPLAADRAGDADPLQRRERQRSAERAGLLAALAAAEPDGSVGLWYARSDGGNRAAHPSRWLLEMVAVRDAPPGEKPTPVYASELPRLFGDERPWLRRVASAFDGLARTATPASQTELQLQGVARWYAAGRPAAQHPLAARADRPFGRAVALLHARRSTDFTAYDGNLSEAAGSSRIAGPFGGHSVTSATAVERWFTCPFRYWLASVVYVEPTKRPEDLWTLNPADKGTLVHRVFERFYRELLADGRCTPDDSLTEADHARLDQIAAEEFERVEALGQTGHPIAWENVRAQVLADLHAQLARDEAWQKDEQLFPAIVEGEFGGYGRKASVTWPPPLVRLDDGTEVRFSGAIDRVDFSPPGVSPRKALVVDYKSGKAAAFAGLEADPVDGGAHVQLALYTRALRAAHPDEQFASVRAEYRFVSGADIGTRIPVAATQETDRRLEEVVQYAANRVRTGVFLPNPGESSTFGWKNCGFCDYERVCSTDRDDAFARKAPAAGLLVLAAEGENA